VPALLFLQGRMVAEYLGNYKDPQFKLQLGARSPSKLSALINDLGLKNVESVILDVLKVDDVERAVQGASVVVNCAGPFLLYGENIIASVAPPRLISYILFSLTSPLSIIPANSACARQGKHYVDTTGETWWVYQMIKKYVFQAHSIIYHLT
jgi:short subunit dehydrogenase-like uncharacterized protein